MAYALGFFYDGHRVSRLRGDGHVTSVAREQGALLKQSPEEFTRQRLHHGAHGAPGGRRQRDRVPRVARSEYMTDQALSVDGGLAMHG